MFAGDHMLITAGYAAVISSEAAFLNILIQYWANQRFPEAASCTCNAPKPSAGLTFKGSDYHACAIIDYIRLPCQGFCAV